MCVTILIGFDFYWKWSKLIWLFRRESSSIIYEVWAKSNRFFSIFFINKYLVPFKVTPLIRNILMPAFYPILEALLKRAFCYRQQLVFQFFFYLLNRSKTYIHTYIIGHYNPSSRIIDGVFHTTYVVCVNFIHKWRDLQFKVDSER